MIQKLLLLAVVLPVAAFAEGGIGKVSSLEGSASRAKCTKAADDKSCSESPAGAPLKAGDEIFAQDVVTTDGNIKISLNDETVIKLAKGTRFYFAEAQFAPETNERQGFWGSLSFGKVWAHVTKAVAGSDQKFQVSAGRAVAGVRGTIFRIDATQVVARASKAKPAKGAKAAPSMKTRVVVTDGVVGVEATLLKMAMGQAKGPRKQVAGPQEISKDEWEKKFAELQKNRQVVITDDSFEESDYDPSKGKDTFDNFVDKQ